MSFSSSSMSYFKRTRKIKSTFEEIQFEWEIANFFAKTEADYDVVYESPVFTFADTPWILRLSLSARTKRWTLCMRYDEGADIMLMEFEFGFRKVDGSMEQFCMACDCFELHQRYFIRDWKNSEFLQRKHELALTGGLAITCTLKQGIPRSNWPPVLQESSPITLASKYS